LGQVAILAAGDFVGETVSRRCVKQPYAPVLAVDAQDDDRGQGPFAVVPSVISTLDYATLLR